MFLYSADTSSDSLGVQYRFSLQTLYKWINSYILTGSECREIHELLSMSGNSMTPSVPWLFLSQDCRGLVRFQVD